MQRCCCRFAGALAVLAALLATPARGQGRPSPAHPDTLWVVHDLTTAQSHGEPWPSEPAWQEMRLSLLRQGFRVPGSRGQREATIQEVFGYDTRRQEDTAQYPWSTQCKIYSHFPTDPSNIFERCSGTLIAPGYVLTAAHCVYQSGSGGWADDIEVIPGLAGDQRPYGAAHARQTYTFPGYVNPDPNAVSDGPAPPPHDWDMALIALDDPSIGHKTGWMGYVYIPAIKGTTANLPGYPTDLDQGLRLYSSFGPIDAATDHQVIFHFPDAKGESGSGLFRLEPDGTGSVFAVDSWSNDRDNEACRIDETKLIALQFVVHSQP